MRQATSPYHAIDIRKVTTYICFKDLWIIQRGCMKEEFNSVEFKALIEILTDRLEAIRGEILDSEEFADRMELKKTEEALKKMLHKLENPEVSSVVVA